MFSLIASQVRQDDVLKLQFSPISSGIFPILHSLKRTFSVKLLQVSEKNCTFVDGWNI